ncbi:MAG: ABC transporter permease [Bryobacterales bacterium]|nr:ABC transporter permease [Bryobacterales bacterium]
MQPRLERTIAPADGMPDAPPVVVLGYPFWQRFFGSDPRVRGAQMRLNGKVRTVAGVMPPRFMWRGADVYLPIVFERGRIVEGVRYLNVMGRLKRGVTAAHVLLFTIGIAVLSALVSGLAPALRMAGADLATALKQPGRGVSGSLREGLWRKGVVATQVALALLLLIGASLTIRTLVRVTGLTFSFTPSSVLTVELPLPVSRYSTIETRNRFLSRIGDRAQTVPGVEGAAWNTLSIHLQAGGRPYRCLVGLVRGVGMAGLISADRGISRKLPRSRAFPHCRSFSCTRLFA